MEIHVKLCGFCNPMFDPEDILVKLEKACPGRLFQFCSDAEKADLVLNGCPTACVEISADSRAAVVAAGFSVNGKAQEGFQGMLEAICSLLPEEGFDNSKGITVS